MEIAIQDSGANKAASDTRSQGHHREDRSTEKKGLTDHAAKYSRQTSLPAWSLSGRDIPRAKSSVWSSPFFCLRDDWLNENCPKGMIFGVHKKHLEN